MQNIKELLTNKLVWVNYIVSIIIYDLAIDKDIIYKAFKELIVLENVGVALFTIIGFVSMYALVVAVNFALLWPVNWFFNKTTKYKNIIYKYYSTLLLLPSLAFNFFVKQYDIGPEGSLISVGLVVLLYICCQRGELKIFKTWGLAVILGLTSIGFFILIYMSSVLSLAFAAAELFKLRKIIGI